MKFQKAGTRVARTGGQMGLAYVLIQLIEAFNWWQWQPKQIAAVGAVLTLLVGLVQNLLEENHVVPNLLEDPVTTVGDDTPDAYQPEGGGQ